MPTAAIIGLGAMGKRHLEAYQGIPGMSLVAVCDVHQPSLDTLRQEHPSIRIYTSYEELLAKEKPDILSVVTLGPTHADIVAAAANAGVPRILCEKTMATSVADAERMIEACRKNNVRLAINHSQRWYSSYLNLRSFIKTGVIGPITHIHFSVGGGRIGCSGTHFFDAARFFTGSDAAWAVGWIDERYAGDHKKRDLYDPGGFGMVMMKNGVRVTFDLCEDLGLPERCWITGSVGRIMINDTKDIWAVEARRPDDKNKRLGQYDLPVVAVPTEKQEQMDMVQLVRTAATELLCPGNISCTGEDGKASMEMALAVHLSHQRGNARIDLPLQGQDKNFTVKIT